jgi:hypothetical protein
MYKYYLPVNWYENGNICNVSEIQAAQRGCAES